MSDRPVVPDPSSFIAQPVDADHPAAPTVETPSAQVQAAQTTIVERPSTPELTGRTGWRPSLPLSICLAVGLAAGIALARPSAPGIDSPPAVSADGQTDAAPAYGAPAEVEPQPGAGTGSDAQPVTPPPAPVPPAGAIAIADFDFGTPITVAPGSVVTVTNGDGVAHTLTADGGLFDTGSFAGGTNATFTAPGQPGTYTFFCQIHPSMRGTLAVTG